MPVRKTDTEFGGRGGEFPPAEFVPTEDLSAAELARLERRVDPAVATDSVEDRRAAAERRALKNDRVGKKIRQ